MEGPKGAHIVRHNDEGDSSQDASAENSYESRWHDSDISRAALDDSKNGEASSLKLLNRLIQEDIEEENNIVEQLEEELVSGSEESSELDLEKEAKSAENLSDNFYNDDFAALKQASADLVRQVLDEAVKIVSEHGAEAAETAARDFAEDEVLEERERDSSDNAGATGRQDLPQQHNHQPSDLKTVSSDQHLEEVATQGHIGPDSKTEHEQLCEELGENSSQSNVDQVSVNNSEQLVLITPSSFEMGAAASTQGEIEVPDPRFAAQSTAAMSTISGGRGQSLPQSPTNAKSSSRMSSSMKSSGHMSKASRSNEGYEDAEVRISQDGFSQQEVSIMEGQVVRFVADRSCSNNVTILQVIHDGEELRPVIGGFQAALDDQQGVFQQQLNLEGDYKFALSGIRCTPLMVKVRRRTDLTVEVTDEGFMPTIMYIDQGTSVKWSWKQTVVPHTVTEMTYVEEKGCLCRHSSNQGLFATSTGTHRQTFNRPGLHYFRTEGSEPGKTHLCVVCVQSSPREYKVEVLDRSFQPMILLIEEGDRVWFSWDRLKCKKTHSVYQIEPPSLDHNEEDPYEPTRDGFKWATPSKQGLMCHRFDKTGVFYFSDQNFEEAAEYIGTIIVKPKQREHIIKVQKDSFEPELLRAVVGDRVWWTWDGQATVDAEENILLLEEDKVLTSNSRKSTSGEQSEHFQDLDTSGVRLLSRVGAATVYFSVVGTYTYRISNAVDGFSSCSILVNPGSKNHTIHLTDNGFEPKVMTVHCNDRVWWVWQSGKKQHNIIQVSHRGLPIPGGYCSGQARDSPSAFVHQFCTPGVFYFMSKSLPEMFGAVVVSTRPQVHEVMVKESEIRPDPVCVQLNDVVAWLFGSPRQYDVTLVETVDQVLDVGSNKALTPRRCFAKVISQTGTLHFKSLSFQKKKEANFMDETRLSSVVCDERRDSVTVQVDKKGFHPSTVCLQKGQSLMWSWKGTEEEHNIIHVTDPCSATPLNMIKGPRAFNSGRPLPNDSFLYTFDEDGNYTVISQGAPGFSCTVNVMEVDVLVLAPRTRDPCISSEQIGGTVERYSKMYLACDTPDAKIYYTLDGSVPNTSSRVYNPERGVRLRESGFHFVRAIAVADQHLQSHIFTSKRFWVLSKGDIEHLTDDSGVSDEESAAPKQTKSWDWLKCKPTIKGCFTSPGVLEVFWEPPVEGVQKEIKAYQILLNGVSYCKKFPSSNNSVKLVGLAGGRNYSACVQVFPTDSNNQILESNILQMISPKTVQSGGPLISLETISDPKTLCLVWMSISSNEVPITGYLVYLNDQQCGPKLIPDEDSNRCKVVISGCDLGIEYKLFVHALVADSDETRMSNILVVQLPLDTSSITLPPPEQRVMEQEEAYLEYIEVLEGSGYLPEMDDKSLMSSEESQSEISTGSESESEKGSASESEMELPRERQLKQQDAKQQGQAVDNVVDGGTAAVQEDCSPLLLRKSFSNLETLQTETTTLLNIAVGDPASARAQNPSLRKRASFRTVAQSVRSFLHKEKRARKPPATSHPFKGKRDIREQRINWTQLRAFVTRQKQTPSGQAPVIKITQPEKEVERVSDRLRSVLKTHASASAAIGGMASPAPSCQAPHVRNQRMQLFSHRQATLSNSFSDDYYEDDYEQQDRSGGRTALYHGHDYDFSDDSSRSRGKRWHPPTPRPVNYRQDSYPDEVSDNYMRHTSSLESYHHRYDRPHASRVSQQSVGVQPSATVQRSIPFHRKDRSWNRRGSIDDRRGRLVAQQSSDESAYKDSSHDHGRNLSRRIRSNDSYVHNYRDIPGELDYDGHGRQRGEHGTDGGRPRWEHGKKIYREEVDSDTASDKDSVEHLYISPRYAERLDGQSHSRKSVQFYFGPADDDDIDRGSTHHHLHSRKPRESQHLSSTRHSRSFDSQVSDSEALIPEDSSREKRFQYVVNEPYGDVPMYRQEREPTPSLPMETKGMLSRYLEIVSQVPFIREDLLDDDATDQIQTIYDPKTENPDYLRVARHGREADNKRLLELKQQETSKQYQRREPVAKENNVDTERVELVPCEDVQPVLSKRAADKHAEEETSGSESAASSDLESDAEEQSAGGHVVILDASKNEATDTRENLQQQRGQRALDKGKDAIGVTDEDSKEKRRKEPKAAAMIKVLKEVDPPKNENMLTEDGLEKSKLAVTPSDVNMMSVREGEMVQGSCDGLLPAPSIMATTKGRHSVRIAWELPRQPDNDYKLLLYVVNVVGTKFSTEINSDISYECNLVEKGKSVRGVQHCWNIQDKELCLVRGLQPGLTYRIYVIAHYSMVHGNKPCEIQTTSSVLYYTTVGPPKAPRMRIIKVDMYQACIAWEPPEMHENARLKGYQINVDGKPLGGLRNPDIQKMVINNISPGRTISINVIAVMTLAAQESAPSKTVYITCPYRPPVPCIAQQPSYKTGCVLIAWDKPLGQPASTQEAISSYAIYVDGQWHGEVKANRIGDNQGYQFFLTDLEPEQSYDIAVKAVAGDRHLDPDEQHIYCLCESAPSNIVPVMAPAAPKSPKLRLEGLHPNGIDVTWQTPQQSGDAHISGYQMLRNGKLYGSIIPPDVNSLRIRDVSLGEKITLQLIALTEHPVGKGDYRTASGSVIGDKDSGISGSITQPDERPTASPGRETQKIITFTHHMHARDWPTNDLADVFAGDRYSGCKPGPKLIVHYTGLVCPPSEVWCEQVTGHSALIVWKKVEDAKAHFVPADSYQVTWWPGGHPEDDINSDSTTDDHLLITSLRPATVYTVVVEARKTEKYTDMDEGVSGAETPDGLNAFILSSKSEHLTVKTASPPDPPRNVGVTATTCSALSVAWDPPQEHGSEIIALRIECISLNSQDPHHVTVDAMPDATSSDITGLHEKTDYLVRVIAVTDEYFDRLPDKHRHKKLRAIPRDVLVPQEESQWLPSVNIVAKTAGTEAPANLRLTQSSATSITLSWTPPLVYGSNKLMSQIVRWRDVRRTKPSDPEDLIVASHVSLLPTEDKLTISDLVPGSQYEVVIEAIVSLKTSLNPDQWDAGIEKYRRTAHVMSKPLTVWTRAPIDPPRVLVVSYDQNTANLYWEKPLLMSTLGKDADGNPRYLRRYLEGYRLEINGKLQSCLGPSAQTCTLTKCKAGKTYHVVLVAMTCTEDRHRERREKFKGYFKTAAPQSADYASLLEDNLLDQAPSEPVDVALPKPQEGFLETLEARFIHQEERDSHTFGDIEVSWTVQGSGSLLKQFSIIWFSSEDRVIQTKYVGPEKRRCTIPVKHLKTTYHITVEPCYYSDVLPQQPQGIQIMVPGPPDPPEIFLRSQSDEELVIEWGEPRCYGGVKVKGYQVYMNDKKIGNELSSAHRKAVIPCRMNKTYRINLVALSATADFDDSAKSNTLVISNSKGPGSITLDEHTSAGDDELPLKVTGMTESGIHLDWSSYIENTDVAFYKIQWSSVAQPTQREVRLSTRDVSCVINKCLPGTTHFVRLVAFDEDGQIIEKSKQLTVQTSAPPDPPILSVRACNFRYIAVQWEKPTTYGDALITGYKVYVNGIVEAVLSADALSFTFTQGKWCQEYSFQVQALTAGDHLNSKPSEPLILTWPGTLAPQLHRVPAVSSSSLRVTWDNPYLTEGVKIKHFKLCCVEEDTEKLVQSIGPIHPDTREAEFKHLKKGNYLVYLEIHLYGTGEVVQSEALRMQPAVSPDPPQISVTVVGLEERRQLEKLACDLANKRDRLIRTVGHKLKRIGALMHPFRAEKDEDVLMGAHALTGVEELLETCFTAMENYTGQLIAHVSWQCPQSKEDVHLAGFKVLVDGKQYGSSMHAGVRSVRLQLGLEEPSYRLSMVSLSDKPQGTSVESEVVELLSAPFKPYAYYCYHNIHSKGTKWPSQGCCKYQDSLAYERKVGKKLANQGLLSKHVPPPACSQLDIFTGDYKSLMNGHRSQCPTILLFWTPWCLSSQKIMDYYVRFARESSKEFNFVAVSCGVSATTADDRQALVHQLTSNGWREDGIIWHCTSECASNVHRAQSTINHTTNSVRAEHDQFSEKYMDLTELLGIAGVPTFLFIHPEGYISWHGRYSSFDYSSFSAFLRHTNSEVIQHPCPVFNCDCCKNDMSIDEDLISVLLPEKTRTQPLAFASRASFESCESNLASVDSPRPDFKYVAINGVTENANSTEKIFVTRKSSPRRKPKLSINRRPYSASAAPPQVQSSPYLAKVVNASSPPTRSRSRPVSAKLVHYM